MMSELIYSILAAEGILLIAPGMNILYNICGN